MMIDTLVALRSRRADALRGYHIPVQVRALLQQHAKRAVLAVFGRPLRCELCDEVLATAMPILWKGEVKLIGIERSFVAVDFASMNRLVFRHAQAGVCRAQRV